MVQHPSHLPQKVWVSVPWFPSSRRSLWRLHLAPARPWLLRQQFSDFDLRITQVYFLLLLFGGFLAMQHGLRDLASPTRDWTWAMAVKAQNPNHYATRELPGSMFKMQIPQLLCQIFWFVNLELSPRIALEAIFPGYSVADDLFEIH